jgi:thiopeptide-type bacteriocin biosynthesis protein
MTMAIRLCSQFLLRAPLLPARALSRAGAALLAHPLGEAALALASADLAAARTRGGVRKGAAVRDSIDRYGRRAAFRPTPSGLLAGVAMGTLATRTVLATGHTEARLRPSWARLSGLARALVDDPDTRENLHLRMCPSLYRHGAELRWLAFGDAGALEVRDAQVDEALDRIIAATTRWAPWPEVRHAAGGDADDVDELLVTLIDGGLVLHDLEPPLVTVSPYLHLRGRLPERGDLGEMARGLDAAVDLCARGDVVAAREALARFPGARADGSPDLHGVLVHTGAHGPARAGQGARGFTLDRRAVERAAAVAPLLFRLQEALAAPVAERALQPGLVDRLDAVTERFGAGALDLAALATGAYGEALAAIDDESLSQSPPPEILSHLIEVIIEAAHARRAEVVLSPHDLDLLLARADPPPTWELVLAPAREPRGARPGTGWLLGLHAPAGASFGRFAEALGAPMTLALAELGQLEQSARPGEDVLDVAFAASPALADLSVHPPVRAAALALTTWADGDAIGAGDLDLVLDPAALESSGLRRRDGTAVRPSPLHRVRSTTVPAGLYRLLAGWSFARQHAPWALSWGPLASLPFLPRVVIDGFVIAPASWRLPDAAAVQRKGALARWRREGRVPRHVQVGEGDELLFVDLQAPGAMVDLARSAGGRAFEIWPPLDRLPDRGGRRIEAVVAVVAEPDGEALVRTEAAIAGTGAAGRVLPPSQVGPAHGWATFKIFGPIDRQDDVLLDAVAPAIKAARAAGQIDGWFFLRYAEEPAHRHHLRVRVHATESGGVFANSFLDLLAPLRHAGAVAAVDETEYFRECARYGGPAAMPLVERLFEHGSDLTLALLAAVADAAEPLPADRIELCVRGFDALARAAGLDLPARHDLARRRRDALARVAGPDLDRDRALSDDFRRRGRGLTDRLSGRAGDVFSAPLAAYEAAIVATLAVAAASFLVAAPTAVTAALGPLLHLTAVRLTGAAVEDEAAAYVFWDRALDSVAAREKAAFSPIGRP